jgi:hypothetical protein
LADLCYDFIIERKQKGVLKMKNCEDCYEDSYGNKPCDYGTFCETNYTIQARCEKESEKEEKENE